MPGQLNQSRELGALQLPVCLEPISCCQRQEFISSVPLPYSCRVDNLVCSQLWATCYIPFPWGNTSRRTGHFYETPRSQTLPEGAEVSVCGCALWLRSLYSTQENLLKTGTSVSWAQFQLMGRFCSSQDLCGGLWRRRHGSLTFSQLQLQGNTLECYDLVAPSASAACCNAISSHQSSEVKTHSRGI